MRAVGFFLLLKISISQTSLSNLITEKASNMSEKGMLTTSAMIAEVNLTTPKSTTNTLVKNSTIDFSVMKTRLVLTPIKDLSVPVEEPEDILGKMSGKSNSRKRPKYSRDNIQTATGTIDPDFDPYHFNRNYRTNTVKNQAISYSLLILMFLMK